MRITFITPPDSLTGGIRVIATYAKCLQRLGHSVLIVCAPPDRPENLRLALRALRRADLPGAWRAAWQAFAPVLPEAGHIANSGVPFVVFGRPSPSASMLPDADLLIATWWETAVWADAMPASKGRKVHLIQGYEIWTGGDVRARVNAALRLPNRKIAISSQLKFDIEAELGDLDIRVVPNAVDLVLFDAPNRDRGDPPTVGFTYSRQALKAAGYRVSLWPATGSDRRSLRARRCVAFRFAARQLRIADSRIDGLPHARDWCSHWRSPRVAGRRSRGAGSR